MGRESALCRSAFAKGVAAGRGKAMAAVEDRLYAEIIVTRLTVYLGPQDPALVERIHAGDERRRIRGEHGGRAQEGRQVATK